MTYSQRLKQMSPTELAVEYHTKQLEERESKLHDPDEDRQVLLGDMMDHEQALELLHSLDDWKSSGDYEWLLETYDERDGVTADMPVHRAMLIYYQKKTESVEDRIESGEYTRVHDVLMITDYLTDNYKAMAVLQSLANPQELLNMRLWLMRDLLSKM